MLQALRDEIIVKPVFEKQKGLIEIPKSALKFKQYDGQVFGEVVSVGSKHKLGVQIGDRIVFQRHEGKIIQFRNEKYLALRERWIMGKVN